MFQELEHDVEKKKRDIKMLLFATDSNSILKEPPGQEFSHHGEPPYAFDGLQLIPPATHNTRLTRCCCVQAFSMRHPPRFFL